MVTISEVSSFVVPASVVSRRTELCRGLWKSAVRQAMTVKHAIVYSSTCPALSITAVVIGVIGRQTPIVSNQIL